jgi:[ribosomal protein S18]-alanine N-acetyltransferase
VTARAVTARITPLPPGLAVPLAVMHRACFPEDPWDAPALDRILALSGVFGYLACEADAPTGFAVARDLGEEAEVLTVGVLPEARRHGVGRALLDAVLIETRRRGLESIVLEVAADNGAARRLYAGRGFRQVGRRPRYYRRPDSMVDALILRRSMASEAAPH